MELETPWTTARSPSVDSAIDREDVLPRDAGPAETGSVPDVRSLRVFRIADEVVDDSGERSPAERRAELERIRAVALGRASADDTILEAFQTVRTRSDIPDAEIDAFVDAMVRDIATDRYETWADLDAYMRGSAAAVGAVMTAITEPDGPETAGVGKRRLGEAFQLTNFVRDVREDVRDRDRVYLPAETLSAHGCSVETIERLEPAPAVRAAIATAVHRAESRYRTGSPAFDTSRRIASLQSCSRPSSTPNPTAASGPELRRSLGPALALSVAEVSVRGARAVALAANARSGGRLPAGRRDSRDGSGVAGRTRA